MLYTVDLPVPKNTPIRNPVVLDFNPTEKILKDGGILFDLNSAKLVGARILDRNSRIIPAPNSLTTWITGDGEAVPFEAYLPLSGPPFRIKVECYNLDDTFDRTVQFRLNIVNFTMEDLARELIRAMEVRNVYEVEKNIARAAADSSAEPGSI